jgi:exosortase J
MSSLPAAEVRPVISPRLARLSPLYVVGLSVLLAALGLTTIRSTVGALWALWTTDALKSIGMLVPIVSLVLILRVWRSLDWEMDGNWWGLVVLVVTIIAVHLRDQSVLVLILSPQWSIYIPPHSLVIFAYVSGAVLLFGGTRLYRAALFPIVLTWFVNPVPHVFNILIDLPLQRVSAHVARAFAIALGQPLSPDQMRLMFTPDFGMFIAPGCNGIRGAVTMGFIALIAGYLYRFRWYAHAGIVAAAIALGYIFNFVRLCTLVLYYIVALHIPWLQTRAEMGDYIIGGCLFLVATFLLIYAISRLGRSSEDAAETTPVAEESRPATSVQPRSLYLRLAAMFLVALFGGVGMAQAIIQERAATAGQVANSKNAPAQFPPLIGSYKLARTWDENLIAGTVLYHWAEYAPADGGTHVLIGISPVLGSHDTMICHSARGEDPSWHDELDLPTVDSPSTGFSASFFSDGSTMYLEASTICNGSSCGERTSNSTHFGFVYSHPGTASSLFLQDPARPIPILLRAETTDTAQLPDTARQQMTTAVSSFLASANLAALTQPYRRK